MIAAALNLLPVVVWIGCVAMWIHALVTWDGVKGCKPEDCDSCPFPPCEDRPINTNPIPIMKGRISMKTSFKDWIKAAGVRAVKTVAQTAVATIGTSAVMGEVNWIMVGSASLLAGILSLLTSVAGLPELKTDAD